MRNVLVCVYDSGGNPISNARIGIEVFNPGGFLANKYTNSRGEAEFDIDYDELAVYVNGDEKIRRGSTQGKYRVQL